MSGINVSRPRGTAAQRQLSRARVRSAPLRPAAPLRQVESLGIVCRVSAYFLVSQFRDPDREVRTKPEHSASGCGPEAEVAVTRGLPLNVRMPRSGPRLRPPGAWRVPRRICRSRWHSVPTARPTAPRTRTSCFLGGRSDASPPTRTARGCPASMTRSLEGRNASGRER